ncbi:MAG: lysophospholipase [Desulfatitalea sp. BRH_c12]|nr:MAG: lysophospholipase [Desulfatitalea sp. BRH_c12]
MGPSLDWKIPSEAVGTLFVREWPNDKATWTALLAHGYGEHIGRYGHVAEALRSAGAAVVGPDHQGHGRSDGERATIIDFETVVSDLHDAAIRMTAKYSGLPTVLIGHSMGGMIAARYAQRYGSELAALVLSGPMFGSRAVLEQLLAMDPIPDIPLDPATLSRDPAVGHAYADDPLVWHGPFKAPTLRAMLRMMDTIKAASAPGDLPMLWLHGAMDPLVPMAETRPMMQHLRGRHYEEKIYAGAMHEVFNETNKNETIADVIDFVRRHLLAK